MAVKCDTCTNSVCSMRRQDSTNESCPMSNRELFDEIKEEFHKEENRHFYEMSLESMVQSITLTRVMETMNFCKLMKYKKIGIAYCGALSREAKIACDAFREKGFDVCSVGCKAGGFSAEELLQKDSPYRPDMPCEMDPVNNKYLPKRGGPGMPPSPEGKTAGAQGAGRMGPLASCDPIGQAILLNREKTEFNIVIGLCVGHDSLFFQYADAPCTEMIIKDRVLGNNPVMDLYYRAANDIYK